MIPQELIEQILDRTNIVDVVSREVSLQRKGTNYVACCPFHQEKTPSFVVNPARNTWHCFGGCQEGGNAITFVMKQSGRTFPEAVKYLANLCGIAMPEQERPNLQEREKALRREALLAVNSYAQHYFVESFNAPTEESATARAYAYNRWGKEFCTEAGIGYAPAAWQGLTSYAAHHAVGQQGLLELGLATKSAKNGQLYDLFRSRITIPIYDRVNRIIGFTARYIGEEQGQSKYINSKNSILYSKENTLFGVNLALRAAARAGMCYMVEGAPDVLRLQSLGVDHVVASLGSSWTERQLKYLHSHVTSLCFLPDADPPKVGEPYGTGIKATIKNATTALTLGFNVTVKEIPLTAAKEKNDPDSYIRSRTTLEQLPEVDFLLWYAAKCFTEKNTQTERQKIVEQIAELLSLQEDELKQHLYIDRLTKLSGASKSLWSQALNNAKKRQVESSLQQHGNVVDIAKYGFQERENCYFSISREGNAVKWSNFIMHPLFHIYDAVMPLRIYELRNTQNVSRIVEFRQEDLVSLQRFRQKIEGLGNYVWQARDEQLTKLKLYLYESTETATRIDQMGWQRQGFYAFGNGIFSDTWHPVDELGIVRLGEKGNYYLPAYSKIYAEETTFYQFERNFVHLGYGAVSLKEYCRRLIEVFGDNAKVGIGFLLATLFRDVVIAHTKSYPLLNIFGPKGTGKSELGHSLMAFFVIENTPPNIQNSTVPALADTVAQCSNALVHLDELKSDIDITKREFLKGLWDGTGRNRMNMERDKKREVTKVSCGVIISGQEMATADVALFSRFILLSYAVSTFSAEAQARFSELRTIRRRGCTHLTLEILQQRKRFEAHFATSYATALQDLTARLQESPIEDRILRNWVVPLTAVHILAPVLEIAFTYEEMLDICVRGAREQNACISQSNELSAFWLYVSYLQQDGKAWLGSDFKIQQVSKLQCRKGPELQFEKPCKVLFLRFNRISHLFEMGARNANAAHLPSTSLIYYLTNSPGFLGKKLVRFDARNNGQLVYVSKEGEEGRRKVSAPDLALCFDYQFLQETYGINFETEAVDESETEAVHEQPEPEEEDEEQELF